jgi:hypothetical protein
MSDSRAVRAVDEKITDRRARRVSEAFVAGNVFVAFVSAKPSW